MTIPDISLGDILNPPKFWTETDNEFARTQLLYKIPDSPWGGLIF